MQNWYENTMTVTKEIIYCMTVPHNHSIGTARNLKLNFQQTDRVSLSFKAKFRLIQTVKAFMTYFVSQHTLPPCEGEQLSCTKNESKALLKKDGLTPTVRFRVIKVFR